MFGRKKKTKTCSECLYFDNDPARFTGALDGNGYCRRYPPYKHQVIGSRLFPENVVTHKDETSCGEFKRGDSNGKDNSQVSSTD